jgi:hypothetical protein
MHRAWLQPGQAKLVQPFSDRAFMHLDGKSPRHLGPQVDAPPTDDAIDRWIGAADHQVTQFGQLLLGQIRLAARALSGFQTRDARRVVAMHPVAQSLPVHAIEGGRIAARPTLQHQRQGKHATHLRAIGTFARQRPQFCTGVVRTGDLQRRAHRSPQANRLLKASNQISPPWEIRRESQGLRGLV